MLPLPCLAIPIVVISISVNSSWGNLILYVIGAILYVAVCIYILGLNAFERSMVHKLIKKIISFL